MAGIRIGGVAVLSPAPPIPYVATYFDGAFNENYVEVVSESPGQDPLRISADSASNVFCPVVSPDAGMVVWERGSTLRVANSDGTGETQLLTGRTINCVDWSTDSSLILFSDLSGSNDDTIRTIEPDGSNETVLYTDPSSRQVGQPSYNFNGTKIAFLVNLGGSTLGLWTADSDGSNAQQAASWSGSSTAGDTQVYAWSPTSNHLVYRSSGTVGLHVVEFDGTNDTTIVTGTNIGFPLRGCWSPDGQFVYYFSDIANAIMLKAAADGSGTTAIFNESATSSYGEMIFVAGNDRFYVSGQSTLVSALHKLVASYELDGSDRREEATAANSDGTAFSMF